MYNQGNKSEIEQIKELLLYCLKRWHYFVVTMFICGCIAVVYLKTATPVMKVASKVSLRHNESLAGGGLSKAQSLMSSFGFGGKDENIEDETLKLSSQGYVKNVIKALDLNKVYTQKEWGGIVKTDLYDQSPIVLSVDPAMSDTISKNIVFTLDVKEDRTKVKIKAGKEVVAKQEITSYPATFETSWGNFTLEKSPYYDSYELPIRLQITYTSFDFMAQVYREILAVDFEKKTSDLISMELNSTNVVQAKRILEEMINGYNNEWDSDKVLVADRTIGFIDSRLGMTRDFLTEADKQIQQFKDKYSLTEIEADVSYYLTLSGELQSKILAAETQLNIIDIIVNFVQDEKNKYSLIPFSLPLADENNSMSSVIEKYNESLIKRNEFYKSNSQSSIVRSFDEQIETQRKNLLISLDNIKKGSQISLANIKKKEKEFNSKIGNVPSIEKDYVHLRREQEIQQTIYVFLLQMREEAEVKSASLLPKLKVIDPPYVINKRVSPNLIKTAVFTLFGWGILSVLSIYAIPYIRSNIRKRKRK
jgi:uncharacterized protein involved in exopolysaccharide biosynthesis